jgi:hypothetical protein
MIDTIRRAWAISGPGAHLELVTELLPPPGGGRSAIQALTGRIVKPYRVYDRALLASAAPAFPGGS